MPINLGQTRAEQNLVRIFAYSMILGGGSVVVDSLVIIAPIFVRVLWLVLVFAI